MSEEKSIDIHVKVANMEEPEIIAKLSSIHKDGSMDPQTLCSATLHDFNFNHEDFDLYPALQGQLFNICNQRKDAWTHL